MDRRELADIGLTPCDLRDVSALALDRDPTELLARRARERRRDAFGQPRERWPDHGCEDRNSPQPDPGHSQRSRSGSPDPLGSQPNQLVRLRPEEPLVQAKWQSGSCALGAKPRPAG